jgi:hypothetical protein
MEQTNKTVYWLRWVAVLPAAVAAYFVIQFIVAIGHSIGGLPALLVDGFCQIVNSIVGPYCFVYAGARTAPRYSFVVAVTLAVVFAILNGSLLTLAFTSHRYSRSLTWLVISCILGIAATILACVYFHEQDKQNTNDA